MAHLYYYYHDQPSTFDAIRHVEADVDLDIGLHISELDDWYLWRWRATTRRTVNNNNAG